MKMTIKDTIKEESKRIWTIYLDYMLCGLTMLAIGSILLLGSAINSKLRTVDFNNRWLLWTISMLSLLIFTGMVVHRYLVVRTKGRRILVATSILVICSVIITLIGFR